MLPVLETLPVLVNSFKFATIMSWPETSPNLYERNAIPSNFPCPTLIQLNQMIRSIYAVKVELSLYLTLEEFVMRGYVWLGPCSLIKREPPFPPSLKGNTEQH